MKKFIEWSNKMTEFKDLDEGDKATVKISCVWGIVLGIFLAICPSVCFLLLVLTAMNQ
jgi:hypothetical protein